MQLNEGLLFLVIFLSKEVLFKFKSCVDCLYVLCTYELFAAPYILFNTMSNCLLFYNIFLSVFIFFYCKTGYSRADQYLLKKSPNQVCPVLTYTHEMIFQDSFNLGVLNFTLIVVSIVNPSICKSWHLQIYTRNERWKSGILRQ